MIQKIKQCFNNIKYRSKLILLCILVSFLPLSVMGFFCYNQTINLLRTRELDSLESSILSVSNSLDSKVNTYQNLLAYLANSNVLAEFSSYNEANAYDQYEYLNYTMDVFLNTTYLQHPEISQITIYNADGDMTHGKQLRPISDLENESWYFPEAISYQPAWYKKKDGTLCVIQYLCDPYITYIRSYSKNCIAIQLDPNLLFGELDQTADDFHIQVDSPRQTLFSYKSASLLENSAELRSWVTRTSPVNACGWTVTLERPEKIVFASVRNMGRVIMAILFICAVIIFSITQLFTSFFEQKISALHYYLQRIKEGHLDYHIHDDSTDELGDLTNNLQAMIDEINRLIREDYQTKIELKETQFKALQAQINPHFLYNTLDTIIWLAESDEQKQVVHMVESLSDFFRTSLNQGKDIISIKEEIQHVRSYLEIQQMRYQDILEYEIDVPEEFYQNTIPKITVQPLVENALYHGIKNKRGKGKITVRGYREDSFFILEVRDNGIGMQTERLEQVRNALVHKQFVESKVYGLYNVNERIRLNCGEEYGLRISSTYQEGTTVKIFLPDADSGLTSPEEEIQPDS